MRDILPVKGTQQGLEELDHLIIDVDTRLG